MLARSVCPERCELERLLSGQPSAAPVEELARHLDTCAACAESFAEVCAASPFVATLRQPSTQLDAAERQAVNGLIARLTRLTPPGGNATPPADPVAPDTATYGGYEFLAPSERPDELGRLGGYRILKELGRGGMGIVFDAEDALLQRRVALKVMQPALAAKDEARRRFLREARAAATVQHDHVVSILQVGEERGLPFLSMPLLAGETLEERLRREKRLPVPEALRVGREAALGLAAAHAAGLIHRDVKPGNIWLEALPNEPGGLSPRYRVKILDFGLARPVADDLSLTAFGMIVGTPAYLAPEQAAGRALDGRADLFSLGVVLYLMTTGTMPFRGDNVMALLRAVEMEQPRPPRDLNPALPPALSDLVLRLLAKDPAARHASAAEVAEALAALASEPRAQPAPPRKRRRLLVAVAAALALLAGIGLAAGPVIRILDARGNKIAEVPVPPSGKVVIVESGKERQLFPTEPDKPEAPIDIDADVAAIEKLGGKVVRDESKPGKPVLGVHLSTSTARGDALKHVRGFTELVNLDASGIPDIDAGLVYLKGLTKLQILSFANAPVSNEGLKWIKDLRQLIKLSLMGTRIDDAGLVNLEGLTRLGDLTLSYTSVGDAGMKHLKDLRLGRLWLDHTNVGDEGLASLEQLSVSGLSVGEKVTDDGLAHVKKMPHLKELGLVDNRHVTGTGIAQLHELTSLRNLNLAGTRLTDKDLPHLKRLTDLTFLNLERTNLTKAGVEELRKALPGVAIQWGP
jgi:serine/threonine protein kinase/Leucine-rich repeat (LRR) protein